jgi:hypothetical protein
VVGTGFMHQSGLPLHDAGVFVLDDLRISTTLTSVTATSYEAQGGTAASWSVVVRALCAFPPPGLELVKVLSARDGASPKGVAAACPAGKRVLATGGEINGAFGEVRFTSLYPFTFFGAGAMASAAEDQDGNAAAWSLKAYAVCATA